MRHRTIALPLLLLTCTLAVSQVHSTQNSIPQRGDIFAGFSYVSNDAGFSGASTGADYGWKAGVDWRTYKWVAIASEFAMGSGQVTNVSSNTYTALVGPRVFLPLPKMPKLVPFADALAGITHVSISHSADSLNSSTSGTATLDLGMDYRVLSRLYWRAQLGYLYNTDITHINDEVQNVANPPAWHLVVFTGPVVRF